MLFNSIAFMFGFLPVCLLGFALLVRLGRPELALNWLTLMSLVVGPFAAAAALRAGQD